MLAPWAASDKVQPAALESLLFLADNAPRPGRRPPTVPESESPAFFTVAVLGDPCDYDRLCVELDFLLVRRRPRVTLVYFRDDPTGERSPLGRRVDSYGAERKLLREAVLPQDGLRGVFEHYPNAVVVVDADGEGIAKLVREVND